MPSGTYTTLLMTASSYMNKTKAEEVIGRQLARCQATPDSFSAAHLKTAVINVTGALGLYVADDVKRDEMVARIKALVP